MHGAVSQTSRQDQQRILAITAASAVLSITIFTGSPALADDVYASSAAVDQPRINIAFAPASDPTSPYVGLMINPDDPFGELLPNIDVQGWSSAYFDTGASGMVISPGVAGALGLPIYQVGGTDVVFSDVSPGGLIDYNISEQVAIRIAPSVGIFDGEPPFFEYFTHPDNFMSSYTATAPFPARLMVGPVGSEGDINVIGMPVMVDKKVVWDPRPTDNIITLWPLDEEDEIPDNHDVQMRSYLYDADTPWNGTPSLLDPGIPTHDYSIRLSYADFAGFTTIDPPTAEGPSFTHNPFIGPNPLNPQPGDPAPIVLRHNGMQSTGSWLLDTGAAASFISQTKAAEVGVSYDPAHPLGSEDPQLLGVPLSRQFQLAIQGISGEVLVIAGFYADEMIVPTEQAADPFDPDDPDNLHYVAHPDWPDPATDPAGAAVLVFDIALEHPDTGEIVTLDGIFGMNFLVASVDLEFTDILPFPYNFNFSPYDAIVFDEPSGTLYLSMNDGLGWPVPEPAGVALLLVASAAILRRRTHL